VGGAFGSDEEIGDTEGIGIDITGGTGEIVVIGGTPEYI
jgi:hypothetical protein